MNRLERWRRKAIEAARQCGRADLPAISEPRPLAGVLGALPEGLRLIGDVRPGCRGIWETLQGMEGAPASVSVIVGPAGGFTARELSISEQAGCRPVSLGPRTLRVETAAAAMLAATVFWLESRRGQGHA